MTWVRLRDDCEATARITFGKNVCACFSSKFVLILPGTLIFLLYNSLILFLLDCWILLPFRFLGCDFLSGFSVPWRSVLKTVNSGGVWN